MARILIVDDRDGVREELQKYMKRQNPTWDILVAPNETKGEQVLEAQMSKGEPIDVLLTDLWMDTEQSGMDMIQAARRIDPSIMAILFTAKSQGVDRFTAFDFGAFDVVEKGASDAHRELTIKTQAALRYRERTQQVSFLGRFFDPRVCETILHDPAVLSMRERTITICFWDIRGFTRLCDILRSHPQLITGFLRSYFDIGAKTIFKHSGVLDKFIGDGIMALFGVLNTDAPDDGERDAISAVCAAIELRNEFTLLVDEWLKVWRKEVPDQIEIGLGCGIHTGRTLVGNIGNVFRDQITALGDNVNFASRIEARARNGQILLSQSTDSRVNKFIETSASDVIDDIKNRPGKFQLYEVRREQTVPPTLLANLV